MTEMIGYRCPVCDGTGATDDGSTPECAGRTAYLHEITEMVEDDTVQASPLPKPPTE